MWNFTSVLPTKQPWLTLNKGARKYIITNGDFQKVDFKKKTVILVSHIKEDLVQGDFYSRNRLVTRSTWTICLVTFNTRLTTRNTLSTRLPTCSTGLSTCSPFVVLVYPLVVSVCLLLVLVVISVGLLMTDKKSKNST